MSFVHAFVHINVVNINVNIKQGTLQANEENMQGQIVLLTLKQALLPVFLLKNWMVSI